MKFYFSVTPKQIERLYSRFTSLDRGESGTLSREDFLRIPELAINPLGDRIVHAFFEQGCSDRVNFLQFMQVLAHFRPIKKNKNNRLNSREQKLRCKYFLCLVKYFKLITKVAQLLISLFIQVVLLKFFVCFNFFCLILGHAISDMSKI